MGGSGGGLGMSLGDLAKLEQKAKEILREGAEPRRNIFISFAHEDLADVNLLRGHAKTAASDLQFNDWSLREPFDSERAEYIKRGIRERIRQSSVTLVYVSAVTSLSDWVDWEIRETLRQGKRVIAMHKGPSPPTTLPSALVENGISPVQWSHDALMKAIQSG
jgi:hypothetical protein